jgi:hypothetical protein
MLIVKETMLKYMKRDDEFSMSLHRRESKTVGLEVTTYEYAARINTSKKAFVLVVFSILQG